VRGCEHYVGGDKAATAKLLHAEADQVGEEGVTAGLLNLAAAHNAIFY
jgi:hypothetical protein